MTDDLRRHTRIIEPAVIDDDNQRAVIEAANAIEQFDAVLDLINDVVRGGRPFRLRPSTVLTLHSIAMTGVHPLAGTFRNTPVGIEGSKHQPPREHLVAVLIEDMCDWVEQNWATSSAVRLCAYVMWRLNWIHPFADGNGRTSRAVAYLVLCARTGFSLPGSKTIPEQIADNRKPYYDALETLDTNHAAGDPDTSAMETLLEACLQKQLESALTAAMSTAPVGIERKFR